MIKSEIRDRNVSRCNMKNCSKIMVYYTVNFVSMVLLCIAISSTLITYNKRPIYTEVLVVPQNEAKYPAVTMCPMSDGYKEHVLQVSHFALSGVGFFSV